MQDLNNKWEAALLSLSFAYPFYAHLLYKAKLQFVDNDKLTAKVNHKLEIKMGAKFARSLSQTEFSGVVLHEVLHVVLGYHERLNTKDHVLFNISHDYIVNGLVQEAQKHKFRGNDVVCLADGCLLEPTWSHLAAEEIYAFLSERVENNGGKRKVKLKCYNKTKDNSEEVEVDLNESMYTDVEEYDLLSESEIRQLSLEMAQLLKEAEMHHKSSRGTLPSELQIRIDAICTPKIHWNSFIRNHVGSRIGSPHPTYMRRSRRSEAVGEILPGWRKDSASNIILLWDTSGSMYRMHEVILSEFRSLVREMGYSLRLIQCDAAVQSDMLLEDETVIVKGHGGSDFRPAFKLLEEENEDVYVIAMTDGEIGYPEDKPSCVKDILWVYTRLYSSYPPPYLFSYGDCIQFDVKEGTVTILRRGHA